MVHGSSAARRHQEIAECFAAEPLADFRERRSLRISQPQSLGQCARRMRFSAASYSFCSSSSWFTSPVTYASSLANSRFFMQTGYIAGSNTIKHFEYFDYTGSRLRQLLYEAGRH